MHNITIFNRYTKQLEYESIFGESFLKFAYNNVFGRLCVTAVVKRKIFSTLYGKYAKSKKSISKIKPFIQKYGLKTDSFEKKISDFTSFNDFFIRKLKPNARPISPNENTIVAPVDGRMLAYESNLDTTPFFVKGENLNTVDLIKNSVLMDKFKNCSLLIARLCPIDYHRFHFPVDCEPQKTYLINGSYLSVNPIAMKGYFSTFLENKRMSTILETEHYGKILMIEIGATCMGSIKQTFIPFKPAFKGEEKGYFEFGGSTIILLFEQGKIKFDNDLLDNTRNGIETYVLMGDSIAHTV